MSSCAASCSICCRQAWSAYATSDSSPTATAQLCCRTAFDCSVDHSKTQLHRPHHPPIRLVHSGTVQSAAHPCASSNGSPLRDSCFARHRNQTGARHEDLSTSSASARASAPARTPCLIWAKPLGCQPLPPPCPPSASHSAAPSGIQTIGLCPTQSVPDPSAPAQTDAKCIGFRGGGFLQVAVPEAPRQRACNRALLRRGALQIQHQGF